MIIKIVIKVFSIFLRIICIYVQLRRKMQIRVDDFPRAEKMCIFLFIEKSNRKINEKKFY